MLLLKKAMVLNSNDRELIMIDRLPSIRELIMIDRLPSMNKDSKILYSSK